jgi:hypothetical protein
VVVDHGRKDQAAPACVWSNWQSAAHVYEVRPRKDHRGFDLISDALAFGRLRYGEPNAVTNA